MPTITPEDLIKTHGVSFGVNDWGSCQYSGALSMFNTLEALTKKHGKKKAFEMLNLKVTYKKKVPLKNAVASFKKEMLERADAVYDDDSDEWCVERKKELKDKLTSKIDVDKMFDICKSEAWDLWSAAPTIAELMFEDLDVTAPEAPGVGPVMNVLVQSENYKTGLYCWLLWEEGLVKDETSFAGFDT